MIPRLRLRYDRDVLREEFASKKREVFPPSLIKCCWHKVHDISSNKIPYLSRFISDFKAKKSLAPLIRDEVMISLVVRMGTQCEKVAADGTISDKTLNSRVNTTVEKIISRLLPILRNSLSPDFTSYQRDHILSLFREIFNDEIYYKYVWYTYDW